MPQVNRQVWHQIIHISPFLVPGDQPIHGKGVAEARQCRATLAGTRLNSSLTKECLEGFMQHPVIQRAATMAEEDAITETVIGAALAFRQVALQGWDCR